MAFLAKQLSSESKNSERTTGFLSALFVLAIVFVPFQNTQLQLTSLRFLGSSLSFVPLLLICLSGPALKLIQGRWGRAETGLLIFIAYSLALSLFSFATVDSGEMETDFLVWKAITNTILNILLIYPIFVMPQATKLFSLSIYLAVAIAILGYIAVDILELHGFAYPSFFQAGQGPTIPRGFSSEKSTFAATLCVLGLIAVALSKNRLVRTLFMLIVLVFVTVLSSSKGTTLCLIMALGATFLISSGKPVMLRLLGLLFVLGLALFVYDSMEEKFNSDIERSSSSSTRSILIASTFAAVVEHPLGVGYSGYLPAIIEYTPSAAHWIRKYIFSNARLSELDRYFSRDDKEALNVKAQFFEYFMVFGLPGLIVLVWFHLRLFEKLLKLPSSERTPFLVLFWFVVTSMATYMPALGMYCYTIAYGVLLKSDKIVHAREEDAKRKRTLPRPLIKVPGTN